MCEGEGESPRQRSRKREKERVTEMGCVFVSVCLCMTFCVLFVCWLCACFPCPLLSLNASQFTGPPALQPIRPWPCAALEYLYSYHSNWQEDRLWRLGCRRVNGARLLHCGSSGYRNNFDGHFSYSVASNEVYTGTHRDLTCTRVRLCACVCVCAPLTCLLTYIFIPAVNRLLFSSLHRLSLVLQQPTPFV